MKTGYKKISTTYRYKKKGS